REIRIAGHEHKGVDVFLGIAQVDGIDDHADVGAVLAGNAGLRDVDHLDAHGMKGLHVLAIMAPVAIGALEHDAALFQHALLDQAHVEITTGHVLDPQGQVFEVDEYGNKRLGGHRMKSPSCVAKQNNCNSAQVYQCAGRM